MTHRTWRFVVLTALAFIALTAASAAATFTVGTTSDTAPGTACTPSSGTCSLRELIEHENSLAASATGDTISVPPGFYTVSNGALTITHSLNIAGSGQQATDTEISHDTSAANARVFDLQVCPPSNVGCPASTPLPVVGISNIEVIFGRADSSNGFFGGNIRNADNLTLTDDVISLGETVNGSGAGVSNDGGVLTINRSLIEDNGLATGTQTTNDSGGVQNFGPNPTTGAAGQLTLSNSTVYANNSALGGGIMSWCGGTGGACSTDGSTLSTTIVNSTITGNDGGGRGTTGGGILASQGTTTVRNSIVSGNTVDNPASGTANNCGVNTGAALTSLGHNLESGSDCGFRGSGDLQNTVPGFQSGGAQALSASPQDFGGFTDVIAVRAASPAVDAVPAGSGGCSGTDQRTIPRPQGSACDIGAFEVYQPVEGKSFTTVVGSVAARSGTTPTINWGDGTPATTATYDTSTQHVTGTHTYAEEGTYSGAINYLNSDGTPSSFPFDLKVQDAPLTGTPGSITAIAGSVFSGSVSSFTDADPAGAVGDYTATVQWGDGSSSAGTVSASGGGFAVSGTHTWAAKGAYTVSITVRDAGGAQNVVSETANVGTIPVLAESPPSVGGSSSAGFSGTVNPNGLATTAHFEYKLDPSLGGPASPTTYDQSTTSQTVGSDSTTHAVSASVSGLVPNALYHVRLVATNSAGTTFGPDQTFTTAQDPPPPAPTLGNTFNIEPVSGQVFIKPPPGHPFATDLHPIASAAALVKGKGFIPLTEARQIPSGSQIDARAGTLRLTSATGAKHGKTIQKGTFTGGLYTLHQTRGGPHKGLTTLSLLTDAFPGAPSASTCPTHASPDSLHSPLAHPAVSSPVLQTLHARDHHGHFRTRTHSSAGTSRGTDWTTIERCDGTLTIVHRGTVDLFDYGKRKTITLHAGQRYFAKNPPKHRKKHR